MLEEFLESISTVFYEAVCCMIFMNTFFRQRRENGWWTVLYFFLLSAGILGCAWGSLAIGNVLPSGQYAVRSIMVIGCIFGLSHLFCRGGWSMKLFLSFVFYAVEVCIDYMELLFVGKYIDLRLMENTGVVVLTALLCKTVLFVVVLGLNCYWKNESDTALMKNSEWILMLAFPILSIMVMLVMLFAYQRESNRIVCELVAGAMCMTNLLLFFLMKYVSGRERHFHEMQLLQEQNKEKMQAYHEISLLDEEQKQILHDYKNHLGCLTELLQEKQYGEAAGYLKQLCTTVEESIKIVDVGNPVLNAVINQKYRLAQKKGISILFYVNDLSNLWLEEQDIVILLSNLLDNAIEASERLDGERIIRLKLIREKKEIVLSVQNRVDEPVQTESPFLPTRKKDVYRHGIGLRNVQRVLDKYQGSGRKRCEDGWFYYTAIIPKA